MIFSFLRLLVRVPFLRAALFHLSEFLLSVFLTGPVEFVELPVKLFAPSGYHGHVVMGKFSHFAWTFPMSCAHFPSACSLFISILLKT